MKKLLLCLALIACAPQKPAASPQQCALVEAQFAAARDAVIDAGACNKVERIENCAAYMRVEQLYIAAVEVGSCP